MSGRAGDAAVGRGAWAEDLGLRFLLDQGLAQVARNYRCRRGEIDLVMRDGQVLVFVEVRYRRGDGFGGGAETVDWRKRARVVASASHYLHTHPAAARRPCRFDVLSIGGTEPRVEWIRNAFQPEG